MAAWVSVSDWTGNGSPFGSNVHWVGLANYRHLLTTPGLDQSNFGTVDAQQPLLRPPRRPDPDSGRALPGRPRDAGPEGHRVLPDRVLLPVGDELRRDHRPLPLSLRSAGVRSTSSCRTWASRGRRGSTTRAASSTSSSASSASTSRRPRSRTGCSSASATGTGWRGRASPCACSSSWRSSPRSGTFMLIFLAALQSIDESVNEAAALDGATEWTKFRYVTVPMIRPAIFTVVTLGLIGTWQVFDQIYTGTKGSPSNTTLTPAFLSFNDVLQQQRMGRRRGDRFHPLRDHRSLHDPHAPDDAQPRLRAEAPSLRADAADRKPGRRRLARRARPERARSERLGGNRSSARAHGAMHAQCGVVAQRTVDDVQPSSSLSRWSSSFRS